MKEKTLNVFRKIAPDVMGTIKERYLLLRHISDAEPVGRRSLAACVLRPWGLPLSRKDADSCRIYWNVSCA